LNADFARRVHQSQATKSFDRTPVPIGAAGFGGLKNGELLMAAEAVGFDVLLTVDQGFQYEQNLGARKIAVVIFCTKSIGLKSLLPHVPACLARLEHIRPGQVLRVGS
jgi:hypothetical protein